MTYWWVIKKKDMTYYLSMAGTPALFETKKELEPYRKSGERAMLVQLVEVVDERHN